MAAGGSDGVWNVHGDVVVIKAATIDMALWKIGGAAVGLRLVQLANVRHYSFNGSPYTRLICLRLHMSYQERLVC